MGFLLLVLSYFLTISRTVELYQLVHQMELEEAQGKRAVQSIEQNRAKLKSTNRLFSFYLMGEENDHEMILVQVTELCEELGVTINSYPEIHENQESSFKIYTTYLELQGDFKSILKLIHSLETDVKAGRVSSVNFQLKENKKNKQEYLVAEVYLQNALL